MELTIDRLSKQFGSKRISPEVGRSTSHTMRMRVVLPAPFGPSRPNMPLGMRSVRWSTASFLP